MAKVHVLLKKEELDAQRLEGKVVVVLDILFATSSIVTALAHGATEVIATLDGRAAQAAAATYPEGSYVLSGELNADTLPRLVNRLWFHNIMVHVPHHVDARIPFHRLPAAAEAIAAAYPATVRSSRLSLGDYLAATRACKLYDFEAGRWLPYSAADDAGVEPGTPS